LLVLSEIYCHSVLRWVRKNLIGWAVPAAHLLSQGGQYETEDEEPLNERDVRQIRSIIDVESESYFCVLAGRIAPQTRRWAVIDRSLASAFTGGRLLIIGRVL
jgi:hypothetical protein